MDPTICTKRLEEMGCLLNCLCATDEPQSDHLSCCGGLGGEVMALEEESRMEEAGH